MRVNSSRNWSPGPSLFGFGVVYRDFFVIAWMLYLQKLKTLDMLCRWGITSDQACPLCQSQVETLLYLFFECLAFSSVQKVIKNICDICCPDNHCPLIITQFSTACHDSNTFLVEKKLFFNRFIYYIWQEHYSRNFYNTSREQ